MTASQFFRLWVGHLARQIKRKHLEYRLKHIDSQLDVVSDQMANGFQAQKILHKDRALIASDLSRLK